MSGECSLRAVVAIPARNEQDRLTACLQALSEQKDRQGNLLASGVFGVLLLLNNCTDGSTKLARSISRSFPSPLRVVERHLPLHSSHAGGARRAAMDDAASWLEEAGVGDGLLLTSDADSRVGLTWIADNLAEADAGADAVAGVIALEPEDEVALPDRIRERGRLEGIYERQLIEISALLDPRPHNPWPHHGTMSGASLAVKVSAYRRIGGLPALPLGEDKGLIAALEANDARIRFALNISVVTSGRLIGRAVGGVADTIRLRCEDPNALCDEMLEPAAVAALRAGWRGRLRRLHADGRFMATSDWALSLGIEKDKAIGPDGAFQFGRAWKHVEVSSPLLKRHRLSPSDLPAQIKKASVILRQLRRESSPRNHVEPKLLGAMLSHNPGKIGDFPKKQLGGVIS